MRRAEASRGLGGGGNLNGGEMVNRYDYRTIIFKILIVSKKYFFDW